MSEDAIGDRWEEVFTRVDILLEEHGRGLSETEHNFLTDIQDKLATYREQTWLSATQLNWITLIEDKFAKPW